MLINPEWSFEQALGAISQTYQPGGMMSGVARNTAIEAWGQLVGSRRAVREFDQAVGLTDHFRRWVERSESPSQSYVNLKRVVP